MNVSQLVHNAPGRFAGQNSAQLGAWCRSRALCLPLCSFQAKLTRPDTGERETPWLRRAPGSSRSRRHGSARRRAGGRAAWRCVFLPVSYADIFSPFRAPDCAGHQIVVCRKRRKRRTWACLRVRRGGRSTRRAAATGGRTGASASPTMTRSTGKRQRRG